MNLRERVEARDYTTRSAAVRGARRVCRKLLNAPHYQAAEGPDYGIHPRGRTADELLAGLYRDAFRIELRGPALDALKARERL